MAAPPPAEEKETMKQLLVGTFVHCKSRQELEILHSTIVAVDGRGTIVAVRAHDPDADSPAGRQTLLNHLGWKEAEVEVHVASAGQFFFPGFIDTHVHASQYPNVGIFGQTTLLDWLDQYTFPLEASLEDLAKARRVYRACVGRTLAHGTTTAAYYATTNVAATNLLADICFDLGQRAFIGRVCMDMLKSCPSYYHDASPEAALEATLQTVDHIRRLDPSFAMLSPILTPRFAASCTDQSMLGLSKIHRDDELPVQTHISENKAEIELVGTLFPGSSSYADVYDRHGLLTSRTVLAHAIHLTDDEARLIAERRSKVSHCPCSNSAIASGEARVRWLWRNGIQVGLGTDMSAGYSPSVLEAARQATLVSRHLSMRLPDGDESESVKLSVEEVLYLATRGGAHCLGLAHKLGRFEVGMQCDAQLIGLADVDEVGLSQGAAGLATDEESYYDPGNVDIFGWETWPERIAKWLYNGDDRNTKKVWIRGRLVHSRP